jgi:septal ring factor EnvC (AmiA/AmiB activator)
MYSEEFYKDLKEFYSLEKKQIIINEELNKIKNEKNKVKIKIINYMIENEISNKNIKIGNENLKLLQVKQIQPLSFKFLKDCLEECISNQDQIDELISFIKSKRSVKEYLDIKKI